VGALLVLACGSRTGLGVEELDAGARPDSGRADAGPGDACVASEETCNGLDDDCDGVADDGLACFTLDGEPIEALRTTTCGVDWYSYDAPDSQSANPRPDIRASGLVVVAIQYAPDCPGASVALITDLPNDDSGGELDVGFEVTPPPAAGLLVSDEPDECELDPRSGVGFCDFAWVGCCTDGLLVGPLTDGCVTLRTSAPAGLDRLHVLDGAPDRILERPLTGTMRLCAQIRPPR